MAASTILAVIPQYIVYSDSITLVLGCVGNALNLLVFLQLKCFRDQRVTLYLAIEMIASLINRILSTAFNISSAIYKNDLVSNSIHWCRFRYIAFQLTAHLAFSMICLAAIDQFCSTNYRLRLRQCCTFRLARRATLALFAGWLAHCFLFAYYLEVQPSSGCIIWSEVWTRYSTYFFYPGLFSFLPVAVASFFSLLAYRNVRRIIRRQIPIERRRFDHQITAMVLIRVVFFAILVTPFTCYRIYTINAVYNKVSALESAISRLSQAVVTTLLYIQYGTSFYLYMWISARFRRQVKFVLRRRVWPRCRRCCWWKDNQIAPEMTGATSDLELE